MTGRKLCAPGGRRMLGAVSTALPGQSLTVFLALIATGAIAIAATAFGAWPGSVASAQAVGEPASVRHASVDRVHQAVPVAEESTDVTDTTVTSPDDPVIASGSPEPSPPLPDLTTARSIPLTAADKELLVKVRQAGLWEIPTGQQAQQRAESPIVKAVGKQLAADHQKLDKSVLALAAELDVVLPSTPSDLQTDWMNELSGKSGADYDRTFADRLRAAHGAVFTIIAQVRTGTRNPTIRQFAQTANVVVMRHMTLLESTGLVDFEELPAPVLSQASSGGSPGDNNTPMRSVLIVAMLAAAALIGTVSIRRVRRGE